MPRRKQPSIPDALLDQLLDGTDPRTAFNPDGVIDALKKALAERMLNAEMDQHLSGEAADGRPNTRNGFGQKTVLTDTGRLALDIPRDRQGTFVSGGANPRINGASFLRHRYDPSQDGWHRTRVFSACLDDSPL